MNRESFYTLFLLWFSLMQALAAYISYFTLLYFTLLYELV
jgi:hypothetical protein